LLRRGDPFTGLKGKNNKIFSPCGRSKIILSLLFGEGPDNSLPLDGGINQGEGGGEKEIEKIPLPLAPACTKRFGEGRGEGVGEGEIENL
jgi:hypothetical protein